MNNRLRNFIIIKSELGQNVLDLFFISFWNSLEVSLNKLNLVCESIDSTTFLAFEFVQYSESSSLKFQLINSFVGSFRFSCLNAWFDEVKDLISNMSRVVWSFKIMHLIDSIQNIGLEIPISFMLLVANDTVIQSSTLLHNSFCNLYEVYDCVYGCLLTILNVWKILNLVSILSFKHTLLVMMDWKFISKFKFKSCF